MEFPPCYKSCLSAPDGCFSCIYCYCTSNVDYELVHFNLYRFVKDVGGFFRWFNSYFKNYRGTKRSYRTNH